MSGGEVIRGKEQLGMIRGEQEGFLVRERVKKEKILEKGQEKFSLETRKFRGNSQ